MFNMTSIIISFFCFSSLLLTTLSFQIKRSILQRQNYNTLQQRIQYFDKLPFDSRGNTHSMFQDQTFQRQCSQNRTKFVYLSITKCQKESLSDSVECMSDFLNEQLNYEKWNIYGRDFNETRTSNVDYWYFNDCKFEFVNYGKFNRSYTFWKAENTQSSQIMISPTEPSSSCSQKELQNVLAIIESCTITRNNSDISLCVKQNTLSELKQKWDTLVANPESKFYLKYNFIDNCAVIKPNYSKYHKTYLIWKADENGKIKTRKA